MFAEWQRRASQRRISFRLLNDQELFPPDHAPAKIAIQPEASTEIPTLGPGCYPSQEEMCLRYSFGIRPLSVKGYVIGARTARRFIPEPRTVTPAPGTYQPFWTTERKHQPNYAPFLSKTTRFPDKPQNKEFFPGPGTYNADKRLHKNITWPMKFGAPDWSLVPMPSRRMLRTEVQKLIADREFIKHRNRVAYLSLYES
ncbi:protein pitchfork [Coturnix japonica]|uniref:Ciliary microtubule associated protein 3 n=1 Tax=Coturnix japonica TaxID=93934 RepID=A0A8C2U889_COTJA|nr:protein pitchfork [Coturnix japonica]